MVPHERSKLLSLSSFLELSLFSESQVQGLKGTLKGIGKIVSFSKEIVTSASLLVTRAVLSKGRIPFTITGILLKSPSRRQALADHSDPGTTARNPGANRSDRAPSSHRQRADSRVHSEVEKAKAKQRQK